MTDAQTAEAQAQALAQKAQRLLERGEHEAALAAAMDALTLAPGYAFASLVKAQAARALLRFEDAAKAFEAVLRAAPNLPGVRVNLANTYAELERLDEAEAQLKEAIRLNPALAAAHASLGSVYLRLERPELVEAPSRRALELQPDLAAAHLNLAGVLTRSDPEEAEAHRDAVYKRQQVFVEAVPNAARTALILTTSGTGNTPFQFLLGRKRYTQIKWVLQYALAGQADQLPPYDFVFNAVADADVAGATHEAVQHFADICNKPWLNRPGAIARTYRSAMPDLLAGIDDVVVPPVLRHEAKDGSLREAVARAGLPYPVIVRPTGRHGGEGMDRIDDPQALDAALGDNEAAYATHYVEYRSADGWYRKYRVIFVDREPYPYHLAIGENWLLHYKTAYMEDDTQRRGEEGRFLSDPQAALGAKAWNALRAVAQRLDLDYAGIDFSLLPDGRVLFFESNATMLVHPEREARFAYKNPAAEAIFAAFDAMIEKRLSSSISPASPR
ncbi:MAG: tetratricopeptide repeat protein [Alphaproteobacteria bacterium]|nr:tetratricopeptide repeat protein [Alphaproteobacteria bacterium]